MADLRELTEDKAAPLRAETAGWRAGRDWTMAADVRLLDSADPAVTADMQLAAYGKAVDPFCRAGRHAGAIPAAPPAHDGA